MMEPASSGEERAGDCKKASPNRCAIRAEGLWYSARVRALRLFLFAVGLFAFGTFPPEGAAQTASSSLSASSSIPAHSDSTSQAGSPVLLGGREIFRVQAGIKAHSAEDRAKATSDRLLRLAKDRFASVDSILVSDTDISADVALGDRILFSVFDVDAVAANRDRLTLARERAAATRAAIKEYRTRHSAKTILMGVIWAVVATVALFAVLALLSRLLRKVIAAIDGWIQVKGDRIRQKSKAIVPPDQVRTGLRGLARLARLFLVLIAIYIYLDVVLGLFPWTQPFAERLLGLLLNPLRAILTSVWVCLPGLIFIVVLAIVTQYVLKFAKFVFDEIDAGRIVINGFYTDWAKPTFNIVRALVILFAVIVAYPYIPGSDTEAFKGVSLFIGILFSLGSTSAVANIVAGIILTYMRAFRVGDIIEISGQRGIVTEMTLLATHIRTPKNMIVTIPNATVLGSHVTNFSSHVKDRGLILPITVGIGYDVPWRQVHAMLLNAAGQTEGVLKSPAPFVLQRELEDMCVRYELNVYTDKAETILRAYSDLHKRILDAFNEYGVQIMTPSYEGDREVPAVVAKENWYAPPAKRPGEPGADE